MIDARNIYRKVTRKIYDFTPEQQQNIAAIVWLYRGQSERFIALVQEYIECTLAEADGIAEKAAEFRKSYDALTRATAPFLKTVLKDSPLLEFVKERDDAANSCFSAVNDLTRRIAKEWKKACEPKLAAQKKLLTGLEALATACRDAVKDVDLVFKLVSRLIDAAEKEASAKNGEANWNRRDISRLEKELDAQRKGLVEQLKAAAYFERQAHWLLSRFSEAKLVNVPGLVKLVDKKEIEAADWSLTPGRYVGAAPPEEDEDFDFEATLRDIHLELAELNSDAAALARRIQKNFEGLGV
jgi:type I restriction enzyme M protein